ncbi:GMC oxidoreductase family protein Mala s [Fulvia fulva]|nr:GMC oxidoreductase family protein Mala s [Fulvia fulva]WPV17024.1 GMC oxidoreductase family protein Mala s [Fulvia fulva]
MKPSQASVSLGLVYPMPTYPTESLSLNGSAAQERQAKVYGLTVCLRFLQMPSTQDPSSQTPVTARPAYYDPIVGRVNLDLLTGCQVTKLSLQGKSVTGVEVRRVKDSDDESIYIHAKKETILAAGTLNTPNILQKSGIGPKDLEDAGVQVLHGLPGVGTNLQEAPGALLRFNLAADVESSLDMLLQVAHGGATLPDNAYEHQVAAQYLQTRTGPLAKARPQSVAYLSLAATAPDSKDDIVSRIRTQDGGEYLPASYGPEARRGYEMQYTILQARLNRSDSSMFELPFDGGELIAAILQKPLSRGAVLLDPADPMGLPKVDPNSFSNPIDSLMLGVMVNFTRKIYQTNAMAPLQPLETIPGPEFHTAEGIMQQLIKTGGAFASIARPSGTCPMMPLELGGVVDPYLRIHGLEQVSIVDASIIPMAPASRLGSAVYAIAERASDILNERNKLNWRTSVTVVQSVCPSPSRLTLEQTTMPSTLLGRLTPC